MYGRERDNRHVREGEALADALTDALKWRSEDVLHPDDRFDHVEYRRAMINLFQAFQQVVQDEISQREQEIAYDSGR